MLMVESLIIIGAGAGAGVGEKKYSEPETVKNGPAPQHSEYRSNLDPDPENARDTVPLMATLT